MTKKKLQKILSHHPDFSTYFIGDSYGLVGMMNNIFGITDPLSEKDVYADARTASARSFDRNLQLK